MRVWNSAKDCSSNPCKGSFSKWRLWIRPLALRCQTLRLTLEQKESFRRKGTRQITWRLAFNPFKSFEGF